MPQWTDDQRAAIEADGGTLLVTAAAGSGKTSVLTERIVRLITEKNIDIDRLLVVTFTRAAASEMRERVAASLAQKLAQNPADRHLARQQMLLNRANISTVHSFCASFIRENFKAANVECDFRLLDDGEYRLLKAEVLDDLLEKRYTEKEEGFMFLADMLSGDRNDSGLRNCVHSLFDFLSANDDRQGWLRRMEENYSGEKGTDFWESHVLNAVKHEVSHCILLTEAALHDAETDEDISRAYAPALKDDIERYASVVAALESGKTETVASAADFAYKTLGRAKTQDLELKDRVKDRRDRAKKKMTALRSGLLCYTSERIASDTACIRPAALALISLLRDYISALDEAKREGNVLSFDDLEQITISLLTQRTPDGGCVRTRLAEETSKRFDAILVDEYQDTNPAQALIFESLSQNRENLFMVGDIKQAIYAFRNASPEDFAAKKEAYGLYDADDPRFPARISLSANFRSRSGVTDFVNFLFELTCTKSLGGTDYDESERLFPAGEFPQTSDNIADTELYFLTAGKSEETAEEEAEFIARRIARLMDENIQIPLKEGGRRPLRYSDIAVISRSVKKLSAVLRAELDKQNIPMSAPAEDSFLDIYEVNVATSLLRIIDNPYQDVPLVCVMASPLFGFTPDELALMRTENRSLPMYDAVRRYSESREDIKTASFLQTVEELRREAACCPTDVLLLKIYTRTSLPALMSATGNGARIKNNLDRLVSSAAAFGASGNKTVSAFLRYLDRLAENGCRMPAPSAETDDGVKLMTIHGSKGLEFPVVIVAGNGKFNTSDSTDRYLVHPKLGFGGRIREGNVYYSTVQRDIISRTIRAEQTSEELRILYVALTRAACRLIVCSSVSALGKKISECQGLYHHQNLMRADLADAGSFADWLLPAACMHPDGSDLCAFGNIPAQFTEGARQCEKAFMAASDTAADMPLPEIEPQVSMQNDADADTAPQTEPVTEEFDPSVFDWQYPHAADLSLPTKVSASGISHTGFTRSAFSIRPAFAQSGDGELRGAQAGTAVHLFMSLFDFSSEESVSEQIEKLCSEGRLTRPQADAVNISACEAFISSELGKRITAAAKQNGLLREYGFSFRVPADHIPGFEENSGKVLVSGTADLIFFEDGVPVIVDFKTDRVKQAQELLERYTLQLRLYSHAARSLWKKNAKAYIWSFALDTAIPVPLSE